MTRPSVKDEIKGTLPESNLQKDGFSLADKVEGLNLGASGKGEYSCAMASDDLKGHGVQRGRK
jgi:hypothetical protein